MCKNSIIIKFIKLINRKSRDIEFIKQLHLMNSVKDPISVQFIINYDNKNIE